MPAVNYVNLPDWLQWVVALGVVFAVIVGLVLGIIKLWPAATRFVKTINALADLPQFMVTTARTLELQDASSLVRDEKIEEIHHEVHYNNGSSVKDAIKRVETNQQSALEALARIPEIEAGVAGLYERVDAADTKLAETRQEIEDTRPAPRRRAAPKP